MNGKKAVFFTISAIMLTTILFVAYAPKDQITFKDRLPAVSARVDVANDYVRQIKYSYLPMAASTSGQDAAKALILFVNYTTYLPSYDEVNTSFKELMLNGSINGTPVECYLDKKSKTASICLTQLDPSYKVMRGRELLLKISTLQNISRDEMLITTDITSDPNEYYVVFYQSNETGPFRAAVNISINYSISAQVVKWNISQTLVAAFPIEGMIDPLYLAQEGYTNPIYETNSTAWNRANLSKLIDDQKYRHDPSAPSFIMRLYGNLSQGSGSACCGIESPINPIKQGINACTPKSYIDWCFYSDNCAPNTLGKIWNITGITTYTAGQKQYGFKIDTDHAASYNVSQFVVAGMGPGAC